MRTFPAGKLPHSVLARLLRRHTQSTDPRLHVGPGIGEDAAVIDFAQNTADVPTHLVAKTDPITFATDQIGWYAVHVNANDIAAMGATPRWFLATILIPEALATEALCAQILAQIHGACASLGVSVAGGHTEITTALDRPVVVGQMLGEVPSGRVIRSAGLRPGDAILLTKGMAIEATSLIAREKADDLRVRGWSDADLARAAAFLTDPGISVVADARIALAAGDVHALHDPTEGGVATALLEIATASQVGLEIDEAALPLAPLSRRLCADVGVDPFGVISSGALLIGCAAASAAGILRALDEAGIAAARIGTACVPGGPVSVDPDPAAGGQASTTDPGTGGDPRTRDPDTSGADQGTGTSIPSGWTEGPDASAVNPAASAAGADAGATTPALRLRRDGRWQPLPRFAVDEITRLYR